MVQLLIGTFLIVFGLVQRPRVRQPEEPSLARFWWLDRHSSYAAIGGGIGLMVVGLVSVL